MSMAFDAPRLAIGTLTVIPVGTLGEIDRRTAGRAMTLAPVAVLPLAVLACLVGWLGWRIGLPGLLVGLIMVATLAAGTRALHLDGLADTVDGLGSGGSSERALSIMKRGDIGPMGTVALILALGAQSAALTEVVNGLHGAIAAGLVICCSRAVLPIACRRGVPAARPHGLGAAVAGSVSAIAAVAVWLAATFVLVGAAILVGRWWQGPLASTAALGAVLILVALAVRRLGGITGDVLGAAVEIAFSIMIGGLAA
ncbi:MAG TPA: adenosylcobinamide-GDP ribazoletransferase [Gemmatimonadales bacterium]|nr:adenosylcobinamide-GDP ribazoletransferase [Gemmatimonadales bacterium]